MSTTPDLSAFPTAAPAQPSNELRYADVAVTATANEFKGIYRDKQYHEPDFINTLDRSKDAGISKVMLTGMSLADVSHNESIVKLRPAQCYYTIGVHPYHASELDGGGGKAYLAELEQKVKSALAQETAHIAAFGELGLDYDKEEHASKDVQKKAFKDQLDLFVKNQWDLPLFLHCRNAFDDFVDIMTPCMEKLPRGGLVHSFVGSATQMEKLVSLGLGVSVNGFSFQSTESLEMVSKIPLDRLQLETDAPWGELKAASEVVKRYCENARALPQSKKRDKWDAKCMVKERNESCTMERVALVVAGLKGVGVDEVAEAAWKNTHSSTIVKSKMAFDLGSVPDYDDLPKVEGMPKGCAWGVFDHNGTKDKVGTLNFLTPEVVRNAALEVQDGVSISLNWPINAMNKLNMPGRKAAEHRVLYIPESMSALPFEQGKSWDDELHFNTQCSSQWDSLCHFQHQGSGLAYNGTNPDREALSVDSTESNTMPTLDHWHTRGCIAGRGVLLDYGSYAEDKSIEFHPFDGHRITVDDLECCAAHYNVEFRPGDILLVRTGATEVVDKMDPVGLGKMAAAKLTGLDGSEETARWLWNKRFAAAASDSSSFEAFPPLKADGSIGGIKDLAGVDWVAAKCLGYLLRLIHRLKLPGIRLVPRNITISNMSSQRRIIGVSTKMYFSASRTKEYVHQLLQHLSPESSLLSSTDVFILPDHTTLVSVISQFQDTQIWTGAQDTFWEDSGAYTGEISPSVLAEVGCRLVEVGHAERRRMFGEDDDTTAKKAAAAAGNGMIPLVCIGEKTHGDTWTQAVAQCQIQVEAVLAHVPDNAEVVFAYEPVWAIGAAEPAAADYVVGVTSAIRRLESVQRRKGITRIIYGGSAGPGLFEKIKDGVDGLFLGRFGHDAEQFVRTIREVAQA
ncbi:hypothetical protein F66182_9027 [Fusarium sp. NRRL 66182]|nr:hypothetical protein F66182_9027 [Fusarium sp. NRRL 66182]